MSWSLPCSSSHSSRAILIILVFMACGIFPCLLATARQYSLSLLLCLGWSVRENLSFFSFFLLGILITPRLHERKRCKAFLSFTQMLKREPNMSHSFQGEHLWFSTDLSDVFRPSFPGHSARYVVAEEVILYVLFLEFSHPFHLEYVEGLRQHVD